MDGIGIDVNAPGKGAKVISDTAPSLRLIFAQGS